MADDKELKVNFIFVAKFKFLTWYYTKLNKNPRKIFTWIFKNSPYDLRKKIIRSCYFKDIPSSLIEVLDEWSEKMKNNKKSS